MNLSAKALLAFFEKDFELLTGALIIMAISYVVKQGDCIFSIAFENGFFADSIWDHSNNAELKKLRKDPNVLLPGDPVFVPDKRLKEVSAVTNEVHKYRVKNTPKLLRIQLMYFETPLKDLGYEIDIDGNIRKGQTDSEGWLRQFISPNAQLAKLVLENGVKYELMLGNLDPVEEISGLQGHLYNLGFYEGVIDGQMNEETESALRNFQRSQDLEATGKQDAKTNELLKKLTGK